MHLKSHDQRFLVAVTEVAYNMSGLGISMSPGSEPTLASIYRKVNKMAIVSRLTTGVGSTESQGHSNQAALVSQPWVWARWDFHFQPLPI
jgi:hypothetical protein